MASETAYTVTTYTVEDYQRVADAKAHNWQFNPHDETDSIVLSALIIAARVIEPGVIEAACMTGTEQRRKVDAAAIRAALTGGSNHGN